ncbi:MAG: cupin domain-containing protein [Oscillospiraceae bacterium]|nr:cupin domain-containing protein [Oscillospiraceae bacterium]
MNEIIITNRETITPKHHEHNQYEYTMHEVSYSQMKTAFYTLSPGKSNYPFHYHTANEEVFYVISGSGVLETFEERRPIAAGDVIVCPAVKEGAHKITNTSETEDLIYLDVDTHIRPEIVYYPHSKKLGVRADGIYDNYRLDSGVEYYDGE